MMQTQIVTQPVELKETATIDGATTSSLGMTEAAFVGSALQADVRKESQRDHMPLLVTEETHNHSASINKYDLNQDLTVLVTPPSKKL